jgi:transcriptional regulator with XRE-family HTH domain
MATTTRRKKRAPVVGEVDKIIGQRMRSFRLAKHMSQQEIGKHLGVTFQQIQKYENGKNRLSGSRLVTVAKALGTSVEQIVGSNGNSKDNGPGEYLTALSEPSVIALERMLERLPRSKQREAARAITDLITAILGRQ